MANRRGRGKGRPQQRRTHLHLAPAAEQLAGAAEQDLIRSFRGALRSREPIDLLMTTSAVMSVLDPRQADPFESSPDRPSLAELVDSLIAFDVAETTAALTVIGALTDDRRLAHRIADELATRRQPLPAWLAALDAARAGEYAWLLDDILGDGESHAFEVELTPDTRLTAVVYVDHTLDGVVKDAFVAPESIASMADRMRATLPQEHRLATADLAETRARVTQAVDDGLHTYPPLETDTWPACRPLVEWMLRLLPEGAPHPSDTSGPRPN